MEILLHTQQFAKVDLLKDHKTPKNECLYFPPISFFTLVFINSL